MKHIFVASFTFASAAFSTFSGAAFIESFDPRAGARFSTDTVSGLDWLDVTRTLNRSHQSVSLSMQTDHELEGWRYATVNEFDKLLINFGFTPMQCYDGAKFCTVGDQSHLRPLTAPIIVQMGDTSGRSDPLEPIEGFFGWTMGILADTYTNFEHRTAIIDWNGLQSSGGFAYAPDESDPRVGSFLVRQTSTVPLPATAWLFGSCLLAMSAAKSLRERTWGINVMNHPHPRR